MDDSKHQRPREAQDAALCDQRSRRDHAAVLSDADGAPLELLPRRSACGTSAAMSMGGRWNKRGVMRFEIPVLTEEDQAASASRGRFSNSMMPDAVLEIGR